MENKAKTYNDTTDCEKFIIREYYSWVNSDAPIAYRIAKANEMRIMARNYRIEHLLNN